VISISELVVFVALWPCLSYCSGAALGFAARYWAKWLRPVPGSVLGAVANVAGAGLSLLVVWAA
jgi:hypothetical protein